MKRLHVGMQVYVVCGWYRDGQLHHALRYGTVMGFQTASRKVTFRYVEDGKEKFINDRGIRMRTTPLEALQYRMLGFKHDTDALRKWWATLDFPSDDEALEVTE